MYRRTSSSSNPTVETAYPRAQKCSPLKFRSLPQSRANNGNCACPLQKPDHRSHRVLGGNSDTHVHMVQHQMPFENPPFLLLGQRMEHLAQMAAHLPKQNFAPPLRASHIMRTFWGPPLFIIVGILFLEDLSVLLSG